MPALGGAPACGTAVTLKVDLAADFQHPTAQDVRGPAPCRVPGSKRVVDRENCARVERIVNVRVRLNARPSGAEDLRQPHVELREPLLVLSIWFDQIDRRGCGAAGEIPSKRW